MATPVNECPLVGGLRVLPELAELVGPLDAAGVKVYGYSHNTGRRLDWLVIERDGNYGSIEFHNHFDGYQVYFDVAPSHEHGTALMVRTPRARGGYRNAMDVDEAVAAALLATGDTYADPVTGSPLMPNYGEAAVGWMLDGELRPLN